MPALLLATLALAFGGPVLDPDHTATPDRPDLVNGSFTVQRGGVQVELGVNADLRPGNHRPLPVGIPTAMRIGITDRLELRLFDGETAEWVAPGGEIEPRQGFGAKLRLVDEDIDRWTPAIALQPLMHVGLKRGLMPVTELTLIISQPFGRFVLLDINIGGEYELSAPNNESFGGLVAGSLGVQVHPRVLLYDEVYLVGQPNVARSMRYGTDGGLIISLHPHFALDVAGRVERYGGRLGGALLGGITALLVRPCHPALRNFEKRPLCRRKLRERPHREDTESERTSPAASS
jgi:hypothetical protein